MTPTFASDLFKFLMTAEQSSTVLYLWCNDFLFFKGVFVFNFENSMTDYSLASR